MGFFNNFKLIIAGLVAGLMSIVGLMFYKRGRDIEDLKERNKSLQEENIIKDSNIKVKEKEVESLKKVSDLKDNIDKQERKIEEESEKDIKNITEKLEETRNMDKKENLKEQDVRQEEKETLKNEKLEEIESFDNVRSALQTGNFTSIKI